MRHLLELPIGWLRLLLTFPIWIPRLALARRRRTVVRLELSSPIREVGRPVGPERFLRRPRVGLWELRQIVAAILADRRIRTLVIEFEGSFEEGLATAQTVAGLIDRVRESGVKVLFRPGSLDNRLLWLATAADRISLPPEALLYVPGPATSIPFVGPFLDRLGLRADIVKSGDFKTAGDPLARGDISPAHRRMVESLLDDATGDFRARIADRRGLEPEAVDRILDRGLWMAGDAQAAGLVDAVAFPDEIDDWIEAETDGKVREIDAQALLGRFRYVARLRRLLRGGRPRLAVLHLEGVIMPGPGDGIAAREGIHHGPVADLCRIARESSRIRGLLVRIDSPGGSGPESELVWREIRRVAEKKPVVVSMGDVAASGGYYIAVAGHKIVALPGTLTGSIGALSGKIDASRALATLGVNVVEIGRSEAATLLSPTAGFTEEQRRTMEGQIQSFYELFLRRVADGRGLETDAVHEVAQGRVWTGRQALEHGLIDRTGGLEEALDVTRREVGLDEGAPVELLLLRPRPPIDFKRLLLRRASGPSAAMPGWLALLSSPRPLAWWPDALRIR